MTDNLTGDCSTSSKKRKKACKSRGETRKLHVDNIFEEEFGSLKNSGQGAWSELSKVVVSNLSESVVSLASFDGDTMHSACTGIVIKTDLFGTSYLTSASLVRSFDDESKIMPFVSIEVHLPKKQVAHGWLYKYDLQYNIAVIETKFFPGLRAINLEHQLQFESHSKVVAVGRCFKSGKLMATSGELTDDPSGVYRKELMISTCEITMVGVGGPLVDLDGNFVGMNFYAKKRTPFLPRSTITKFLDNFKKYRAHGLHLVLAFKMVILNYKPHVLNVGTATRSTFINFKMLILNYKPHVLNGSTATRSTFINKLAEPILSESH